MKFEIKGNYFNNTYNLPATSGPNATELIIKKSSPADTDTKLWECPITYSHIDEVISSAKKGFEVWRKVSLDERINYLRRYQEQVLSKSEEIATAIALETGKPLWEAKGEASAIVAKVTVTIEDSLKRVENKELSNILPNTTGRIFYKPIGPCFVIGPFNFPCHLANGQILSALLTGNSIIFKPSEKTCYSAQLLIDCFHEANFPKGVVNLIQGNGETARRILKERSIKGIFFTGSKDIGKRILEITHKDLSKLVALELGGKNTSIIHKDADLDFVLPELLKACFLTTGQRCTSTAIVAIHKDIMDQFIPKFHELAKRIIVDHPIDHKTEPFMGPLIDQSAVDKYLLYMGMAKREGIEEIMRGKQIEKDKKGFYVTPSIHLASRFDNTSHFLKNEIFGPNCTFIPYTQIEEAIDIANSTEFGLASAVFTKDHDVFNQCVRDIDAGILNFNRSTVGASSKLPFGGVKNSGNYRPAAVSTIDACVYPMSSLELNDIEVEDINSIKGIN